MFSGNSWAIASQINDRKEVKTEKCCLEEEYKIISDLLQNQTNLEMEAIIAVER